MRTALLAGTLAATIAIGAPAPALADHSASVRNLILGGAAIGLVITNYVHKQQLKAEERREQNRRRQQYRHYYREKYGTDPTDQQIRDWYNRNYGVHPS